MVAVIRTGYSLRRIVHYNENKVNEGLAEALFAENYPMEMAEMNLQQRLNRLLMQAAGNERVKRNSVHISLNFAPGEVLSAVVLREIATTYMEQIGFGEQPYLVYRHHDAAHPHLHIVSLKIRADGSRIDTQNIGLNQSEAARKAIEIRHGLVRAEDHQRAAFELKPVNAAKVIYGRAPTKRAIASVLESVLNKYKYTSLAELNAVLTQYNVLAERGSEDSLTYRNNGLVYRVIDRDGKPAGVPIKASDFYNRPTLKYLADRFTLNDQERQKYKTALKNSIDRLLNGSKKITLAAFLEAIRKAGVVAVLRQNEAGLIYGITYVDHNTQCVFNGSALGKNYSAMAIQQRCLGAFSKEEVRQAGEVFRQGRHPGEKKEWDMALPGNSGLGDWVDALLQGDQPVENMPFALKAKRKKKKKKKL